MKTIEIESDVLALLRLEARKDSGDLSACIRRLLSKKSGNRTKGRGRMRAQDVEVPEHLTPEILEGLYSKSIYRFICLLGWLARRFEEDFRLIENIRGRNRIYFSTDPRAILASGNSTAPVPIPESGYWVCSNMSNDVKRKIMDEVLVLLGVEQDERSRWIKAMLGVEKETLGDFPREVPTSDDPFQI